jgi:hypothetical protein
MKTLSRMITFAAIWLCFTANVAAIDLPEACRVRNIGPMCAWASLDTLARANEVQDLVGVLEYRRANWPEELAYDGVIKAELDRRGVHYDFRNQYSYDRSLLYQYSVPFGVAVALKAGNPHSIGCHMIVVTHYDSKRVEFYDSSKPVRDGQPKTWRCGRPWFDQWWLGCSIVVFPN